MLCHGTSHAAGAICCSAIGSLLVNYLSPHLEKASFNSANLQTVMTSLGNFGLKTDLLSFFLATGVLAFLWGMVFKLFHYRKR